MEVCWEGVPCGHKFTVDMDLSNGPALIERLNKGLDCPVCNNLENP